MTFYELTCLIAVTTPLFCSLESGWKTGSWLGILVGLIIGLVLAFGDFWGVRAIFRRVIRHPKLGTSNPNPSVFWIGMSWFLCAAMIVWIFGFAFIGMWLTKFVIHHVAA